MMDGQRAEEGHSPSPPLHLQDVESNHSLRNPGDESSGGSTMSDRRRRRRPDNISQRVNMKNGYAPTEETMEGYCVSDESASASSLSSLSQIEDKYTRRKNKKSVGQRDRLYLMMLALVFFSCFFAFYSTPTIVIDKDTTSVDGVSKYFMFHGSKVPRVVTLDAAQFGSIIDKKQKMADFFVAKLAKIPMNRTSVLFHDLPTEIDDTFSEPILESEEKTPPSETAREEKKCLPMAKWMTASFPNCNSVHEISMHNGLSTKTYDDEDDLKFLAQGWFRDTWKYANENFDEEPPVVLKTLRIEREFLEEYFDLHRRDAVAMERLTFSPYVVNVHGYCGQSAINEFAEGILGGKVNNLEQLNRKLRGKESDPQALLLKLQLATKVSLGLAHIHNIHISDESGVGSKSVQSLLYEDAAPNSNYSTTGFRKSIPTMAHYDINPRNIAVMRGGHPKINDFNIAEFLTYDPETNQTCGFKSRLHEPWWRAPEEMDKSDKTFVDEKVDVYALGEVLFHILTTHGPRGKMKKYRMEEVRALVKEGVPPVMWEPYASGGKNGALKKNGIVKAFMKAMDLCFEKDPKKRGTSIQVARVLHKALKKEELSRKNVKEQAQKLEEKDVAEETSEEQ